MTPSKFNETVSKLLSTKLAAFNERDLNLATCVEVYQVIFGSLAEIFETTGAPLGNEAVNYVAQQYYDAVLINGKQELDPNVFTQRAKLENIATKELALLCVMFNGTEFVLPVVAEIKKRS